jgi:proteic killer suppression protein
LPACLDVSVPKSPPICEDCAGQFAIWVNDRVRVCFEWKDGGAENVEIADYH